MTARAEAGFGSLEEVADAVAAYLPHRRRPRNLEAPGQPPGPVVTLQGSLAQLAAVSRS